MEILALISLMLLIVGLVISVSPPYNSDSHNSKSKQVGYTSSQLAGKIGRRLGKSIGGRRGFRKF